MIPADYAPFVNLPAASLEALLRVCVDLLCKHSAAAEAGDPVARLMSDVNQELLTRVVFALKLRGHHGDAAAVRVLDDFDRWFYTSGPPRSIH